MDLAEINAELRKLRDRDRKKRQREANGVLSLWCLQVAACIAVLLDFDFKAAADWLDSWCRRGKRLEEPLDLEAAQPQVEDFVLNTPDDHLGEWTIADYRSLCLSLPIIAVPLAVAHSYMWCIASVVLLL